MNASANLFVRTRSTTSKENVENVVNAPSIPIVRNFCAGSLDIENKLKLSIVIPIRREPITLTRSMLQGKFVPNIIEIWLPRKYLNIAPNAPPKAIASMLINFLPVV